MFRSALLILSGSAFTSLMTLVRNLLVARLISVEDYGVAATFAISMAIVEMMSMLGLQQMIVQDKDGNDPEMQAALQGFQLLRALVAGLALFFLAGPLARFLGIPEIAWAYQLLALVPVLNGLMHFDIYRMTRRMNYRPAILSRAVPALISVLLVWPLYQYLGDYRVMLYAVLAQWIMSVGISHLVAERRFRLVFDRGVMARGLRFGWPLLVNGILLFAVFHGEKLIVGREMGMAVLAIFAMGFTLTLTPTLVLAGSTQAFLLPQLSAAKESAAQFRHLATATLQFSIVNGLLLLIGVMLFGVPVVRGLLGDKYEPLVPFLLWLAILHGIRVFKAGGGVVALSQAKTENAMLANMFRVLSLPISWYVAVSGGSLLDIIWIATGAEICGYAASLALVSYRLKLPLQPMIRPIAVTAILLVLAGFYARNFGHPDTAAISPMWLSTTILFLFGVVVFTMTDLREYFGRRTLTMYSD